MTGPDRRLGLLGLGRRAGTVIVGVAGVRARLQADGLACVVLAADAGKRTREKVERLAVARGVPVLRQNHRGGTFISRNERSA